MDSLFFGGGFSEEKKKKTETVMPKKITLVNNAFFVPTTLGP